MPITERQLRLLRPYLVGAEPSRTNKYGDPEWDMICPLHEDRKRSASLNTEDAVWNCFVCGGGSVAGLIKQKDDWVPPPRGSASTKRRFKETKEEINFAMVDGWHSYLMSNAERLAYLYDQRELQDPILQEYKIGFDQKLNAYTIPILDADGKLVNIRRYNPFSSMTKVWSVPGYGSPRLFPVQQIQRDEIIICEGEWDALLTIQNGYPAITRTGAADVWEDSWSPLFEGKRIYLCHDMDLKGQKANIKIKRLLESVAEVIILKLPYPVSEDHGQDLTDFFKMFSRDDFEELLHGNHAPPPTDPTQITVKDALNSERAQTEVNLPIMISGKVGQGFFVPRQVHFTCTRDAGKKCYVCPLFDLGGDKSYEIERHDPILLETADVQPKVAKEVVRGKYGILKCDRLRVDFDQMYSLNPLIGRTDLDTVTDGRARDYSSDSSDTIPVHHIGDQPVLPNTSVLLTGATRQHPKTSQKLFHSWDLKQMRTAIESFEITPERVELMRVFQTDGDPIQKLKDISKDIARSTTHIVDRTWMHMVMDLTFHSILSFRFADSLVRRGWLDSLILGDTRTGKSETAQSMIRLYAGGEFVSCEGVTSAGIIGGLNRTSNAEWWISWGAIPNNDKRLVVLDEANNLPPEGIADLAEIRSAGVARLHKIEHGESSARTRLIWLANARNSNLSKYIFGVEAIKPLIVNDENIARFDLAMTITAKDVDSRLINAPIEQVPQRYSPESLRALLAWVWTREPQQIFWDEGAEALAFNSANLLGEKYVEDPPLIQGANVRIKIARIAAAIAARLFSSPDGHNLVIRGEHIEAAVEFIDRLYEYERFGYAELSRRRRKQEKSALRHQDEVLKYIRQEPLLMSFLSKNSTFSRRTLEGALNAYAEQVNGITSKLYEWGMIEPNNDRIRQGEWQVMPVLYDIIRAEGGAE